MCETQLISRHIGRIGRRSFDRRMRMASPLYVERRGDLTRLLNDVDRLSERLHDEFASITEDDYRLFGPELKIVISTLKALRQESMTRKDLKPYNERMRQQIVDLEELDHDINVFRVDAPRNKELQASMASLGEIDFSYLKLTGGQSPCEVKSIKIQIKYGNFFCISKLLSIFAAQNHVK